MEADQRPAQFDNWQPLWNEWHRWLNEHALSPLQACLEFVLAHSEIDRVLVGIDSLAQLKAILAHKGTTSEMAPQSLESDDLNLINPSMWKDR